MTSRERVIISLNHQKPDHVPVDIGGSDVTGIHVTALDNLRKALKLERYTVKAFEPMMMLGLVENDVIETLNGDIIGLHSPTTMLGYWNENWKPWKLPRGNEVSVGGGFTITYDPNGSIYAYPQGNINVKPSAIMPSNGYHFDPISRQDKLSDHNFDARIDYEDQYPIFSDEVCSYYEKQSEMLYEGTEYALLGDFSLGGFGDFFVLPGPWLEHTKGIREIKDWLIAHYDHPEYIHEFFQMQTESTLENLNLYHQSVGEKISIIVVSGTDFGTQSGPLISPDCYREFYKPYHKKLNDWIHKNTTWKIFFHSCGSISEFLDDFIEIGVDIINPVQFTASGMGLKDLKAKYGKHIVFYGGGIDTQKTLPFGTTDEVRTETKENVKILSENGGYICTAVNNIQGPTPAENILAFFNAIND